MTDLDKLIDAVDRGEWEHDAAANWLWRKDGKFYGWAHASFEGSMDSAISFFDYTITKGGWVVSQHIAKVVTGEIESQQVFESVIPRNPARALLISTLKALRSEQ